MRWKLYGDAREKPYRCCWFIHVRTGSVLLGLYSLLNQVIGLFLVSYILSHPDVVPRWLSSFQVSRVSGPQNGLSICDQHAGLRHKRDVGTGMMGTGDMMPVDMPGRGCPGCPWMEDGHMMGGGPGHMRGPHGPWMRGGHMMDGPMMGDDIFPDDQAEDKEKPVVNKGDAASGIKELPYIKDLMLRGQMMAAQDVGNMMPKPKVEHESTGVQLADVLSHPDDKISAQQADHDDDDDDRDLIIPVAGQAQRDDPPHYRSHMDFLWKHSAGGLSADDTFFMYAMMICCIASSALLVIGVIKGRPGHMIPFMGLQAFDFCATALFVFAIFSYLPYLKTWLLSLPDSFPYKCEMLSMKTERLMLMIVLASVCVLIIKAYLMGMVWSCYKYLSQASEAATRRRRSFDSEDAAQAPEDAQLLLPPKYEEIANNASTEDVEAPPPPPYATD